MKDTGVTCRVAVSMVELGKVQSAEVIVTLTVLRPVSVAEAIASKRKKAIIISRKGECWLVSIISFLDAFDCVVAMLCCSC